eukprot:SAG31_NODE_46217_length_255_cov_0.980769_1_plen_55_part_10
MSIEQKIGQMAQLNIDEAFPEDFRKSPDYADAPWALLDDARIRHYTGAPNYVGSW